jgi:homoserine O-acetyltransferase
VKARLALLPLLFVACSTPAAPSVPPVTVASPPMLEAPAPPSAPAPLVTGAPGAQQIADLGACALESGERIEGCEIGYRTYGTLDAKRSNAVLFPTWFTGTTKSLTDFVPGKLVDTSRYFLILVDALADGVSTSPSNSKTQPRLAFPKITIRDMVESQKKLLDALGIAKLHAVMGISMGGMQALEWSVAHPDVPARVVSIVGTPQLASHDLLLWTSELHALESDVAYKNGDYGGRPALRAVLDIHNMMLTTPAHRSKETRRDAFGAWIAEREADKGFDWNDWRRQLEAMLAHDVAKKDGGSLETAAKRVKAKTLVIVAEQDHMVSPFTSKRWAEALSAKLVVLDTPCGHLAPGCETEKVAGAVKAFLAE